MKTIKKILLILLIMIVGLIIVPKMQGTVNAASTKTYKFVQFGNEKFYRIKNIAKKTLDVSKVKTSKTVKYDLDKDGKKDVIKVTKTKDEDDVNYYTLTVNGKKVKINSDESIFYHKPKIYIVDLNKNDKKVEIVMETAEGGEGIYSTFFQKNGNKVKIVKTLGGAESAGNILTNKKGKIVVKNVPFIYLNPYITNTYYKLTKKGKLTTKKIKVSTISKITFKVTGLLYAKSKSDLNKYYETHDAKYLKSLKKSDKFKIVSYNNGVKIKINNNSYGYILATYY